MLPTVSYRNLNLLADEGRWRDLLELAAAADVATAEERREVAHVVALEAPAEIAAAVLDEFADDDEGYLGPLWEVVAHRPWRELSPHLRNPGSGTWSPTPGYCAVRTCGPHPTWIPSCSAHRRACSRGRPPAGTSSWTFPGTGGAAPGARPCRSFRPGWSILAPFPSPSPRRRYGRGDTVRYPPWPGCRG